jgi:hypothetical protein
MNNSEYKAILEYLFGRIATAGSRETLDELSEIVTAINGVAPKKLIVDGVLDELREWIGLKMDKSSGAMHYGDGIVADFPEYFPELLSYVKGEEINAKTVLHYAKVTVLGSTDGRETDNINPIGYKAATWRIESKSW